MIRDDLSIKARQQLAGTNDAIIAQVIFLCIDHQFIVQVVECVENPFVDLGYLDAGEEPVGVKLHTNRSRIGTDLVA